MQGLKKVGQELMKIATDQSPNRVRHEFSGGLKLVVQWREGDWRMGVWRLGVEPSETEIRLCLEACGAPHKVTQSPRTRIGGWIGYSFLWTGPRYREEQRERFII